MQSVEISLNPPCNPPLSLFWKNSTITPFVRSLVVGIYRRLHRSLLCFVSYKKKGFFSLSLSLSISFRFATPPNFPISLQDCMDLGVRCRKAKQNKEGYSRARLLLLIELQIAPCYKRIALASPFSFLCFKVQGHKAYALEEKKVYTHRLVRCLYSTRWPQLRQRIGSPRFSGTSMSQSPHL